VQRAGAEACISAREKLEYTVVKKEKKNGMILVGVKASQTDVDSLYTTGVIRTVQR